MEKVKIFEGDHRPEELEKKYNEWMAEKNEKISVLARKFATHGPGTRLFLAVFYTEIV